MPPTAEYVAPWPVFALAWSNHPSSQASSSASSYHPRNASGSSRYVPPSPSPLGRQDEFQGSSSYQSAAPPDGARLAVGSFVEQYTNRIQILGFHPHDPSSLSLLADASHPYPPTKLAFQPSTLFDASSSERRDPSLDRERGSGDRGYASPTTKLAKRGSWGAKVRSPGDAGEAHDNYPDRELLASTADCLRIWEVHRNEYSDPYSSSYVGGGSGSGAPGSSGADAGKLPFSLREKSVLAHSKNTKSPPAPLTSFSWNTPSPNLIVTSSIDTTCTIWDLPTRTALTQLIAHDREVYDVDWCPGSADVFASVGADGSVRVFDLRSLEHSTIIYETGTAPVTESRPGTSMSTSSRATSTRNIPPAPLLRIAFNPWDANYLATFHLESDSVQILDVRAPGSPILELRGHSSAVNAIAWGPPSVGAGALGPSKGMVCSAADDAQVLVYDLASTTLRTASAQGRRSRNGHAASPAPGSIAYSHSSSSFGGTVSPAPTASLAGSIGIGAEIPFLAYTTPSQEMVNNVSWLRAGGGGGLPPGVGGMGGNGGGGSSSHKSVVQEWNEFTAGNQSSGTGGFAPQDSDWIALAAGSSVRALKV
ncbi:WD40 repeat-like protein [Testicularia cyperi]|uniref:WD40 repeat-like protein n=1 Tax=Testicularia cyperi TaxID=1882483 RepID=A0A317XKX2_9BASI|nr:WD40 repeat-like protein [Testicularia cyperi]